MIPFDKGLDFLDFIKNFHHKLSEFYNNLSNESDKEKIKIILSYVAEHELKMAKAIQDYEEDVSPKISETWFQFVDTNQAVECLSLLTDSKFKSIDEIIESVVKLDECLICIYGRLSAYAPTDDVRTVFENLQELETGELKKLVHNIHRFETI